MPSAAWFTLLVILVGCERMAELVVARRNRRWALSQGGVEYGARHYPVLVALHTGLLGGSLLEVWLRRPQQSASPAWVILTWGILAWAMLALMLMAQALRWWCIATLGTQWNTRIIVVPGHPRVRRGPYRWLRHPNYLAVVVEGVALPLVGSAWITAIAFTIANLAVLAVRIPAEERALTGSPPSDV